MKRTSLISLRGALLLAGGLTLAGMLAVPAYAEQGFLDRMKADVTAATAPGGGAWDGPTSGPAAVKGKKVVFVSLTQNSSGNADASKGAGDAAKLLGWDFTVIDGKGDATDTANALQQAIALKPDGIAIFADASSLQDPIKTANAQGITVIGLHATALPGPYPDLGVFFNIQGDPRNVGKIQGEWAIADSNGTARVVILTHNEYKIAETKSDATKAAVEKCTGCKVLDVANSPASQADQRMAQLTTSWVQRFGPPLYITSVGDNDFDFAVPVLRAGGLKPEDAKLIGADGTRSAYDRLHKGDQYQAMTVSEPVELQAYQAIDEFNRAFNKQPPSGFVQPPYIVTAQNVNAEGGDKNVFIPSNDYVKHYLANWGVK